VWHAYKPRQALDMSGGETDSEDEHEVLDRALLDTTPLSTEDELTLRDNLGGHTCATWQVRAYLLSILERYVDAPMDDREIMEEFYARGLSRCRDRRNLRICIGSVKLVPIPDCGPMRDAQEALRTRLRE